MSRRIADDLSQEFARQAELERAAGLPVTVMLAHDEVGKAKMEVSPQLCAHCKGHGCKGLAVCLHVLTACVRFSDGVYRFLRATLVVRSGCSACTCRSEH
jgi:hypothetical protein